MVCICGLDPGLSGALAFYFLDTPQRVSVIDMPLVDKMVDGVSLGEHLRQMKPDHAFIEGVGAMPKQGLSSTFRFGQAFGIAIGAVAGLQIPFTLVTAAKWKRAMGLNADKERSRAMALQTFTAVPQHFARKKDDGRAEAALLALYGARTMQWGGEAA